MSNQHEIPNHFKRVEELLRNRQRVLSSFNELPRNEVTFHICASTNLLFYKAIVEEMRSIVEAYDYEFGETDGGQAMTIEHNGVQVTATNFKPSTDELKLYVARARELVTESEGKDVADNITSVKVTLCDDGGIDLSYVAHHQKFERIRRITGYLVGTIDRWNDAKQAEEKDRVKHEPKI